MHFSEDFATTPAPPPQPPFTQSELRHCKHRCFPANVAKLLETPTL